MTSAGTGIGEQARSAPGPAWRRPALLLAMVLSALLVGQLGWLALNQRPIDYDPAWYLETAISLERALQQQGWVAFLHGARGAFKFKAPGVSMAAALVMAAAGESLERAVAVSLAAWLVAAAYLYLLARRLLSPAAAALAALLASVMPLAFSMARSLLVEASLTAAVVAFLYHAAASDRLRRPGHALALAAWGAAGLMVKVSFPAYVVAPALLLTLTPWREVRHRLARLAAAWLGIAAMSVGAAAWLWYADNWRTTLEFTRSAGFGALSALYAVPLQGYLAGAAVHATSPWTLASLLVLAVLAATRRPAGLQWRALALAAAWLIPPVLMLASSSNRTVRYLAAVLPAVALALATLAEPLLRRSARTAAVTVLALAGPPLAWFVVATVPSPLAGPVRAWVEAPWFGTSLWYEGPPDPSPWPNRAIVREAARAAGGGPPAVLRLNVDLPELNHNNLKVEALLQRVAVIPAQIDQGSADGAILTALDGDLLLLQTGGEVAADFLNLQRAAVARELATGHHPYAEVASFSLPAGRRVTLLARRCAVEADRAHGVPLARLGGGLELSTLEVERSSPGLVLVRSRYRVRIGSHPMLAVRFEVTGPDGRVLGAQEHLLCRRPQGPWPAGSVVEDTFLLPAGAAAPGLGLRLGVRDLLSGAPLRVEQAAEGLGAPGDLAVAFPRLSERLSPPGPAPGPAAGGPAR